MQLVPTSFRICILGESHSHTEGPTTLGMPCWWTALGLMLWLTVVAELPQLTAAINHQEHEEATLDTQPR